MPSQVNSDIPPSSASVVMLSAPDTQDNPQEAFHTPPEQPSLHSSDVNAIPPSAGSQELNDPSRISELLDEIKRFSEELQVKRLKLGFEEDFPQSAGSQVFVDSSEMELLDAAIDNSAVECSEVLPVKKLKLGFGEDFLSVKVDDSCIDIPMDKNSVPKENVVQKAGGNKSIYEIGEGSGKVGEVSESLTVFDVLKYLASTANKVEDDGLTLLETLKRAGVKFPRPSWWSDDMKSELFNFDDEEQRKWSSSVIHFLRVLMEDSLAL